VVSAEYAQLLLPKLTDEQLATLRSYGTTEQTSVGQILAAAGDLSYDLMVVLEGEVECSDIHDGRRRALLMHGLRDFIAELDLLTGQRVYVTFVVTQAGSIVRVPRPAVKTMIEADSALGELLVQTLFRRREALLLMGSGMQLIGSRYSPDTQRLREFAARNRLAYSWIDLDNDPVAPALLRTLGLELRETPSCCSAVPRCSSTRPAASSPPPLGSPRIQCRAACTTCSSSAPGRPASGPACTERPRGYPVRLLSIPARAAASAWARTDLGHVLSPRDQKRGRWMCRLSCVVCRIPLNRGGISATACFRGCSLSLPGGRLPARE
jgi:CRP-like cAMP-binding protein